MTSQSPRIYLYKITFEEVPYYYYGIKKEKYFNQEYWGSPKTNKWCWELYTPKKQILEIFDFSDEGWIEAQEVEKRVIKPFHNVDKWCLNENCGGKISLKVLRETGKKYGKNGGLIGGELSYKMKVGIHARSKEQKIEDGKKGGSISGKKNYENGIGLASITKEERQKIVAKTNSQKWMCLETGHITTSGPLTLYQNKRGINTSKRKLIE